jgi:DNA (cytosine-5)-methyltransferase 1
MTQNSLPTKTYFEFFAGGGMVHAGLGASWTCVFANDFSAKKAASYQANWGADAMHVGDIADVKAEQLLGHVDLAWASFPCQDLSLAGNCAGLSGSRSGTFWSFVKLMQDLQQQQRKPKIIALENVCGALTSNGGKDFESIISALHQLGYRVGAMVIDAVHFVPQSRPRLFIVAQDATLPAPFTIDQIDGLEPKVRSPWHTDTLLKAFKQLPEYLKDNWVWWQLPLPSFTPPTLHSVIELNPASVKWHTQDETNKLLNMMTPLNRQKVIAAQRAEHLQVGAVYRRTRLGQQRAEVRFDGVSGCLRTPGGGSSRQTILIVHGPNIRSRLLSSREAARLMGLPDTYVLPERYNDAYHLAGDGVVVPVIEQLAKHLFASLLGDTRVEKIQPRQAA